MYCTQLYSLILGNAVERHYDICETERHRDYPGYSEAVVVPDTCRRNLSHYIWSAVHARTHSLCPSLCVTMRGTPQNESENATILSLSLSLSHTQQQMMMMQPPSGSHSFCSSSVMHYSSTGGEGGRPRVYHATSSTRQAGGVSETVESNFYGGTVIKSAWSCHFIVEGVGQVCGCQTSVFGSLM